MMIKLSDEQIKAIGASNANDAQAKIDDLLKTSAKAKTDADNMAQSIAQSGASMKALEGRLAAIEKKEFTISDKDRTAIIEAAKTAAVEVAKSEAPNAVSAAIAKVGVGAVSAGVKADDKAETKLDENADDAAAVWKADAKIRAEFIEEKNWLAYHKANKEGRVSFSNRSTKGE